MKLKQKEIFKKDGKQYIVVVTTNYEGKEYAFANRIEEEKEEVTEEYSVFTVENDEIVYVNDHELINKLLPTFQKQIKSEIEKIMKDNN